MAASRKQRVDTDATRRLKRLDERPSLFYFKRRRLRPSQTRPASLVTHTTTRVHSARVHDDVRRGAQPNRMMISCPPSPSPPDTLLASEATGAARRKDPPWRPGLVPAHGRRGRCWCCHHRGVLTGFIATSDLGPRGTALHLELVVRASLEHGLVGVRRHNLASRARRPGPRLLDPGAWSGRRVSGLCG